MISQHPAETKEIQLQMSRAWKLRNQAKIRVYRAAYYRANKEKELIKAKRWRDENPEANKKIKAKCNTEYRAANAEFIRAYRKNNKEKINALNRARYHSDPLYNMARRIRNLFNQALRLYAQGRKTQRAHSVIGCTMAELFAHIEKQFKPGMSWDNRERWHIDHIRPCASFDLTSPDQQRQCFHYSNLQPLWAKENLRKGANLTTPQRN